MPARPGQKLGRAFIGIKLGRLALKAGPLWVRRFGLDLLFDGIPAEDPDELTPAGVSARQFIALTGESDLYGAALFTRNAATIDQLRERIRELDNIGATPVQGDKSAAATGGWRSRLWPRRS